MSNFILPCLIECTEPLLSLFSLLQIQPILKGRMMTAGTLMIGYQPLDHHPNFFRNIISSQAVRREDIDFMLEELDRLGYDL